MHAHITHIIGCHLHRLPCRVVFEKTANYFSHELGPLRVHTLLPRAKIIIILSDPVKRAYSWYQVSHVARCGVKMWTVM